MKILITGASGFLGKHVQRALYDAPFPKELLVPTSGEVDFSKAGKVNVYFDDFKPDVVIHLAARVGGIGANMLKPAEFFHDNLAMGLNVLEACRTAKVRRLVMVGTTCSYPKFPKTIPFIEEELFDGFPESTNAPYGIAKRALIAGAASYKAQYGLDSVCLIPTNLYGPGDSSDLEKSHVIPALFQKFIQASREGGHVTLWGTGSPTRDFLYVGDAAAAIVRAVTAEGTPPVVNLGSGVETNIATLAGKVAKLVGCGGQIIWDSEKPHGQPRRCLDSSKARDFLGWSAVTSLDDGLAKTYESIKKGARR